MKIVQRGILKSSDLILIFGFLFLLIAPFLYTLRAYDDNTLTSWRWVFESSGIENIYIFIFLAVIFSFYLSKFSWPERNPVRFLFLLSFAAVLPTWKEPEVILDVSRYFTQAKSLELYGLRYFLKEWGEDIWVWTDLPVAPFIYGTIFKLFGELRLYIQFFNSLLFAFTVTGIFLIGKRLWDKETGLYAGLLLLGVPYLLTQPALMLVDIPAMFLFTYTIYFFLVAREHGSVWRIALSSFFIFLTVFVKYSTWPMLLVLPLIAITIDGKVSLAKFRTSALIGALSGLFSSAFIIWKIDVFISQFELLSQYQWGGLERWQESHVSTFLFQTHPLVTAFAIFGICMAVKNRDLKFVLAGWFFIFIILLEVKRIRYIVPMFPLFTLAASYGLSVFKEHRVKRFIGYSIVSSSMVILLFAYLPFLNTISLANLRTAGKYIDTLSCDAITVRALPQNNSSASTNVAAPILDYFTSTKIIVSPHLPSPEGAQTSPLRFTWEFVMPGFYNGGMADNVYPSVIISSEKAEEMDLETGKYKEFSISSNIFRYKTFVTVFGTNCE